MTTLAQHIQAYLRPRGPLIRGLHGIRECPGCGMMQRLPELGPGCVARCCRCDTALGRRRTNPPIATPLAFALSSLVLYLICVTQPLMTLSIFGRMRQVSLFTGPIEMIREGWLTAGVLVGLATTIFPAIEVVLMLGILFGALHVRLPWRVPYMMRWYDKLRPWSMVEVYLLGVLVAYTKMIDLAEVIVQPAVWALLGLMLTMAATDSTLDDDVIWSRRRVRLVHRAYPAAAAPGARDRGTTVRARVGAVLTNAARIGSDADASRSESADPPPVSGAPSSGPLPPCNHLVSCQSCGLVCFSEASLHRESCIGNCPRCGARLRRRKPDSVQRTMIFVCCAVVLYIPANLFPVMTIIKLQRGGGHTILQGVQELYEAKMLPLALLVFFASITVPVLKILSLCLMCFSAWRGSARRLGDRTRLYRIVDFIGRWSMIDVFMVSILVAMVHFGPLANVRAEGGMLAFAAVVVLTIFAANCFDPRVMWDAAGLNGPAFTTGPAFAGNPAYATNTAPARATDREPAQA